MSPMNWIDWWVRVAVGLPAGALLWTVAARCGTGGLGRWRVWAATLWTLALVLPRRWETLGPAWSWQLPPTAIPANRWMAMAWCVGAVAVAARGLVTWQRLRLWRSTPGTGAAGWDTTARSLPVPASCHAVWQFRFIAGLTTPAVRGGRRPMLFLPAAARAWNEAARRQVLIHEAEHVRWGDHRLLLLWALLDAACWWHPAWAWLRRQMSVELERAVDAAVIRQIPADRESYAGLLVGLATDGRIPGLSGLAEGPLEIRVRAILRDSGRPPGLPAWMALGLSIALLLGLWAALVRAPSDPFERDTALRWTANSFPVR